MEVGNGIVRIHKNIILYNEKITWGECVMHLSEAIEQFEKLKKEYGDLPIFGSYYTWDGCVERECVRVQYRDYREDAVKSYPKRIILAL